MSTKYSLFFDKKTHIYQECFDENYVYIDIEENSISTKIKLGLKEIISLLRGFDLEKVKKQAEITDDEIKNYILDWCENNDSELVQYTKYGVGQKYNWHNDDEVFMISNK